MKIGQLLQFKYFQTSKKINQEDLFILVQILEKPKKNEKKNFDKYYDIFDMTPFVEYERYKNLLDAINNHHTKDRKFALLIRLKRGIGFHNFYCIDYENLDTFFIKFDKNLLEIKINEKSP